MNHSRLIVVLFVIVFFATGLKAPAQSIQVSKDNRTIAITTTDEAEAIADRAAVSIGFTTYGTEQDQTYADASKTSNAIMKALKDAGIKPEAIQSTEQNLSAIEDSDKPRYSKGIRFVASQGWTVTVPADAAADTLHTAISAGANNSGNINWQLADESKLEGEASEKALVHARQIAERMTKGLNTMLGPLVYASNQIPPREGPVGYDRISAFAARAKTPSVKPLAIRPDKISKSVTVYAVFSLQ